MKAGTILDAACEGHPAVIAAGVLLLLAAVGALVLWRRARPIYPPRGSLTVAKIQARENAAAAARAKQDHEFQAAIEQAKAAEFQRLAEAGAGVSVNEPASAEVTQEIPAVEAPEEITAVIAAVPPVAVPTPRAPSRARPYTRMRPRTRADIAP